MERLYFCVLLIFTASWVAGNVYPAKDHFRDSQGRTQRLKSSHSMARIPNELLSKLIPELPHTFTRHHHRERRDNHDEKCGLSKDTLLEHTPYGITESAEAIQALWVGRDHVLIVASDSGETGKTTVWIGTPKSFGEFSFTSDSDAIVGTVSPASLQVSDADHRQTVVVVSQSKELLWVSRTAGRVWDKYKLPTPHFDPEGDLYLSNKDPRHMVIVSSAGQLFVSDNTGETWHKITGGSKSSSIWQRISGGVKSLQFAMKGPREYLYYSTGSAFSTFFPLYRMDIASRVTKVIDDYAYRFSVDGRYLFVSRENRTGSNTDSIKSRRLFVSTDYVEEQVTFTEVQLPSLRPEQFYVVMATHETGAFIHVAKNATRPYGELYVSDSTGSRYSLSLDRHMYKVLDYGFGHFTIDDFYEVKSMRGVYITSVVTNDDHYVTKITFDNGGLWQNLTPPDRSKCPAGTSACYLHLHLHYSQVVAPRYNLSSLTGLLSTETAVGIIIAHGSVGAVRDEARPRLYISNDGGYTWMDPGLPNGTYVYGIADYGNIIAIAPDSEEVEFIWFSHDRGSCFIREQLDSSDVFALSRGLLMDPSATSLYAFVMGVEGTDADDEWRMITINFGSLFARACAIEDYQVVIEHLVSDTCILGYKSNYNITKPEAVCYNENGYKYGPISETRCTCKDTDFECDYGFIRDGDDKCSREKNFNLSSVCPPGKSTYTESTSGFRLIPGDKCRQSKDDEARLKGVEKPCTGHEKTSGFDNEDKGHSKKTHKGVSGMKVFGAMIIVGAILLAAGICLFGYLKCKGRPLSRERVVYQKLPITDSRFSATEESSSDEDMIGAS